MLNFLAQENPCLSVLHDGTSGPLAITVLGMLLIAGFSYWMSAGRA